MPFELIKSFFGMGVEKITVEELQNKNIHVIDIRSKSEYKKVHISGAVNIPYSEFSLDHF